jgi:lipopolysaccharide biosynthesis protein
VLKNSIEDDWIDIYEKKLKDFSIDVEKKWAIYGTGNGAEVVYQILNRWGLKEKIESIIERDDVLAENREFHGIKAETIAEACQKVDGIIIASMDYHELILDRVKTYINENCDKNLEIINLFGHNTNEEIREYVKYIESQKERKDPSLYKEFDESSVTLNDSDTKIIAWYLPQFHRIDVNDKFYGRGFTEWTNTTKALPMYTGHYQPHIPYDLGYYSLNDDEVFVRQIELAKHYGIYGFSFYYYWFSGKRIMEKPLNYFLNHLELNIKFCITWANENWSALWDGSSNNLIYKQELKPEDDFLFMQELLPYLRDSRYITINGKKLIIVYRATVWEKERVKLLFSNMRTEAEKEGVGGLYIMLCNARGFDEDVAEWGADALVEFPPHGIGEYAPPIRVDGYLNPNFVGHIRNTEHFINQKKYLYKHNSNNYYRGAMPSWDNTARKAYNGATIYTGLNPDTFEKWLIDIISESKEIHSKEENYVFVNAWNEWAEGTHLEPDLKYGYANLSAIKNALIKTRDV